MQKANKKISYIKKPFSKRGFISLGFSLAALICFGMSLAISVHYQGNGGVNMAAWGLSSLIFSLVGSFYGLISFAEKEKNYIFAKIGLGIGSILLLIWIGLLVVGFAG